MAERTKKPVLESQLRIRVKGRLLFGPGRAELLEHIVRTGSITEAALAMEMSYMRAWSLIKNMNEGWREPLVVTNRGGHERGGAVVTETGRSVLEWYREIEAETSKLTRTMQARVTDLLRA